MRLVVTTAEAIRETERTGSAEKSDTLYAYVRDLLNGRPREEVYADLDRAFDRFDRLGNAEMRDAVGLVMDCMDGRCASFASL